MELDWNQEDVKEDTYEAIPTGDYLAIVEDEESRDANSGNGVVLILKFQIIDGKFKGRKISKLFNVRNESEKAETIGRSQLKSLSVACGRPTEKNTLNLQAIPVMIRIATGNDGRSEVKSFFNTKDYAEKPPRMLTKAPALTTKAEATKKAWE